MHTEKNQLKYYTKFVTNMTNKILRATQNITNSSAIIALRITVTPYVSFHQNQSLMLILDAQDIQSTVKSCLASLHLFYLFIHLFHVWIIKNL